MTPAQVITRLAGLDSDYWDAVDRLAEKIRAENVIPFCQRKGWDFAAGMGTWFFYHEDGDAVSLDRIPKRLRAVLDGETLNNGQSIGSLIARDVRASEGFK